MGTEDHHILVPSWSATPGSVAPTSIQALPWTTTCTPGWRSRPSWPGRRSQVAPRALRGGVPGADGVPAAGGAGAPAVGAHHARRREVAFVGRVRRVDAVAGPRVVARPVAADRRALCTRWATEERARAVRRSGGSWCRWPGAPSRGCSSCYRCCDDRTARRRSTTRVPRPAARSALGLRPRAQAEQPQPSTVLRAPSRHHLAGGRRTSPRAWPSGRPLCPCGRG